MGYRIAISLTKYFTDERSYCYVHVDKAYKLVSDLESHLRNLFDLKGQFCLLNNNFYLPNEENIKVIKDGETVCVVPLQNDWRQKKDVKKQNEKLEKENVKILHESSTCEPSTKNITEILDVTDGMKNTSKVQETEIVQITPDDRNSIIFENDDKKEAMDVSLNSDSLTNDCQKNTLAKNNFMESCDLDGDASSQSSDDNETNNFINDFSTISFTEKNAELSEMQNTLQLLKTKALALLNESASKPLAGVSAGRVNKRKRIRKRTNKNVNISLPIPTIDISETPGKMQPTFSSVKKSSTHIRFSDLEQSPIIIQNEGCDRKQSEKPRMIHALETEIDLSNRSRSSSISVTSMSLNDRPASTTGSICADVKPKYIKDSSIDHVDIYSEGDGTFKLKVDAITSDLKSFPAIGSTIPVPKDIILFKMLKMDENYTPTISDYILANVIEVDKTNRIVKLTIIDGHLHCTSPKGKFDITDDEEESIRPIEGGEQRELEVEWERVVEARLVFP